VTCTRYTFKVKTVFTVFVSFVAYAIGAVACRRLSSSRASGAVNPYEVVVVTGLLVAIALLRPSHNSVWYHVAAAGAMVVLGAAIARATLVTQGRVTAGTREFEDITTNEKPDSLWKRWLDFSHSLVDYEFRLFLVAVYLLIVGPFAIAFRLLGARTLQTNNASNWIPRNDVPSLDAARRPF
jgi:hypothetical protein